MKALGVIPSRMGATRFPNKPLALIKNKPLIRWVVEGVLKSRLLDKVILATDHVAIADVVKDLPCQVVMTDSNLPSGSDRVFSAVKDLSAEIIINIQGDEPLIQGTVIDQMIETLQASPDHEMVTVDQDIKNFEELESKNIVKVIKNKKQEALYFSRFAIPYSRSNTPTLEFGPLVCTKHIGLYGFRFSFLKTFCQTAPCELEKAESLEQLRALYLGAKIKVINSSLFFQGIDVQEDIQRVENWLDLNHGKS